KKTTKKNTPTEKKTDTDEKKTTPKAASEPTTTLLPDLQQLANELLKGRKGSIVAIRPSTGEVICLATNSPEGPNTNLAIATAYAPGSTFKTAQALTFLSEGTLKPETKMACYGAFREENIKVKCHKHSSPLMLRAAIASSCNTYFLKSFENMIGNKAKYGTYSAAIDKWYSYMTSMGLGGPLGIDIPGEMGGLVPNSAYLARRYRIGWRPLTIIWTGMGQGDITVTPLQLCNLAATIANRGYFYTPHIHANTAEHPLPKRFTERRLTLVSPNAYPPVIDGMRNAVAWGTARDINTKEYTICGKTGTVENQGKDHSAFIAFAPMNNPKIAIAVFIENAGFGADVAAPIAAQIIKKALKR
uniref:peptidoglycan D,D-transpeptidase FtsI family protein n=1 Tax=Prevotella pallens TaxID=60133 RepID=UPI003C70FA86